MNRALAALAGARTTAGAGAPGAQGAGEGPRADRIHAVRVSPLAGARVAAA